MVCLVDRSVWKLTCGLARWLHACHCCCRMSSDPYAYRTHRSGRVKHRTPLMSYKSKRRLPISMFVHFNWERRVPKEGHRMVKNQHQCTRNSTACLHHCILHVFRQTKAQPCTALYGVGWPVPVKLRYRTRDTSYDLFCTSTAT